MAMINLFSSELLKPLYENLGNPVKVQVWDPFQRKLVQETVWTHQFGTIPDPLRPLPDSQPS
jgi:hypothetical protein